MQFLKHIRLGCYYPWVWGRNFILFYFFTMSGQSIITTIQNQIRQRNTGWIVRCLLTSIHSIITPIYWGKTLCQALDYKWWAKGHSLSSHGLRTFHSPSHVNLPMTYEASTSVHIRKLRLKITCQGVAELKIEPLSITPPFMLSAMQHCWTWFWEIII